MRFNQWFLTLSTMRSDGSLPLETQRGGLAAYYSGSTLTILATIAKLAEAQGIDLWSKSPNENKTYESAARYFMSVVRNPELIYPYARQMNSSTSFGKTYDYRKQLFSHENPDGKFAAGRESPFGWYVLFKKRFPESDVVMEAKKLTGQESNLAMTAVQAVILPGMSSTWCNHLHSLVQHSADSNHLTGQSYLWVLIQL
jgi:hypothetical protein